MPSSQPAACRRLPATQAWFPAHAEVWNAPTWFLSALTFAMVVLPHVLPAIAEMRRKGLKLLLGVLTAVSLLGKLAYSYDLNAWSILEGVTSARAHPNLLLWNVTRFHPFYALLEVLMGVAAVRLVMTEGVDEAGAALGTPPKPAGSAALPALALLAITLARAAGYLPLNDPLTRGLLFVPIFTLLIMRLHRNTLQGARGLTAALAHPLLTYLGTISFPIFIVHGAIGQLFYKKVRRRGAAAACAGHITQQGTAPGGAAPPQPRGRRPALPAPACFPLRVPANATTASALPQPSDASRQGRAAQAAQRPPSSRAHPVEPPPPRPASCPQAQIIATKVWGGVMPLSFFPAYCAIVLVFAAACQKFFLVSGRAGDGPMGRGLAARHFSSRVAARWQQARRSAVPLLAGTRACVCQAVTAPCCRADPPLLLPAGEQEGAGDFWEH